MARAQCRFASSRQRTITYRFRPEISPDGLVLHVTMSFRASPNGTDTLILPLHWAGETLQSMTDLRAVSRRASLSDGADADSKIVHAPANRPVVLTYDLHKDWKGLFRSPLQFHPVLMPHYLELTGSNALVRLRLDDHALETANFDWQRLPSAWTLATSFGTTTTPAHRCQSFTGHWQKVNEGLYAAGEFRVHSFQINGQPALLAVYGTWTFPDEEAVADIQKVVGMVRGFWHDNYFPYFLFTLIPYDRGGADGSAFTNAFWMYVAHLDSLNRYLPLLAHESFHAWDPLRMGIMPTGHKAGSIGWFREGPTDYYAHLLTYRAGILSATEYIDWLNSLLRQFPSSNDEYVRGPVISLWLDGTIRRESHGRYSLDNVMFDMVHDASQPYTMDRILKTTDRYLSPSSQALLQKAVTAHGDLPAPELIPTLGDCARAAQKQEPVFDLGFDFKPSAATKIATGVTDDGPAFRAGLRNGQLLKHISFNNHDPDHMVEIKVRSNAEEKQITYYPRGRTTLVWSYSADKTKTCQKNS